MTCRILVPQPGIQPMIPELETWVLTTGLPGKALRYTLPHQSILSKKSICQQIWKLSSDLRTGKGQFSFQSRRRAMPKNVQTTVQLLSFHMLTRQCSKSFNLSFNSVWTEKFHIYKRDLEKAQRSQRSSCQHLLDHRKSKRFPEKHILLIHWWC